jgi:hypothetical protein
MSVFRAFRTPENKQVLVQVDKQGSPKAIIKTDKGWLVRDINRWPAVIRVPDGIDLTRSRPV